MRTEYVLLGVLGLAVLGGVGVAVGVPDALEPPEERPPDPREPTDVDLVKMTISPGEVGGENATIQATPYLRQHGGAAENVTVVLRAIDDDTGFVAATAELDYGTLDGDVEVGVQGALTVERQGDYDVEAILYVNGTRIETGSRDVSGVGTLTPNYRDSPLQFQSFDTDLPVIEYQIEAVENGEATLDVSTYLTNTGAKPTDDLELVLTARQNDSNVVADRTTVELDEIGSGKTATPSGELVVPDDYNYYLDAVLWHDGTVVATARSTANLAPGTGLQVDENSTDGDDDFQAGDFEDSDAADAPSDEAVQTEAQTVEEAAEGGQPGFGLATGLVALLALLGVARLARDDE